MPLFGTYAGTVEDDNDPLQMGRLRCRVPTVYGSVTGANPDGSVIATTDLPWALAAGMPAGGTNDSGMIAWLPGVGDHVFVRFLDGEPEKPVWEWGNQDTNQAAAMGGWTRSPGGYTQGSAPRSALLTRYGHLFDFQPDTTTWRTASGFKLRFTDSTQQLDIYAPNVKGLIGTLNFTGTDYQFNPANTFKVNSGTTTLSANTNELKAAVTNTLTAAGANKLNSPIVQLGPEGKAYDPVVRLSDLSALANLITALFDTHTHTGNLGFPTSPPIVPMILKTSASNHTFSA